jgi:hypothetical protein
MTEWKANSGASFCIEACRAACRAWAELGSAQNHVELEATRLGVD